MMYTLLVAVASAAPSVVPTTPIVPGAPATLEVANLAPGVDVRVYASVTGTGVGPCAGATCLDLLAPFEVARGTAGPLGATRLTASVPALAPLGPVWLQAVQVGPNVVGAVTDAEIRTPVRVLMVGDSITEGQQSQPTDLPYYQVTANALGAAYEVVSIGCGGATSEDWVPGGPATLCGGQWWNPNVYEARATPELPVDIATIMLGTNDSTGFFEPAPIVPLDYAQNMVAVIDQLLADGAETVMLLTPPPMCSTADPATVDRLVAYRAFDLRLCDHHAGVVCGPDVYTLLGPADFRACDVHPNGQGHAVLGEAVADAIIDLW
ncbi:MAG: SGNH/GDSL hydrolase family protein [Alphaproteobacteria bacterium]|nr:SGNH/GDSL hydrolase family protein [Alphaproteobacteria bacterium]MCB9695194.1 SGNH/GDSL hydrolase family protein [Alphaproteobacteria bacterium]